METQDSFQNRVNLEPLSQGIQTVRETIGKVIVGQKKTVDLLLVAALADGHVLLEGVPGIAKTLMSKLLAKSLSSGFSRIQFTPDLMPSDILGTSVYNMKTSEFEFKKGPVFANIILIDEINRAPAKTQAALFEVMEERQVTVEGKTWPMESPYLVLATQNPIEQEGTYRLPEAQLDRFLFKVVMDYPNLEEEVSILENHLQWKGDPLDDVQPVLTAEQIASFRKLIREILVEQNLLKYIADIIGQTRKDPSLYLGASPRASIALLNSSRAYAALQGRDFVTPEDIKFLAVPVLQHRILLTPERELEGVTVAETIQQLVNKVEVPR
ncbi:MAG TPA: magnesium chelatase [Cryomorphaceae bacterium]|nr:magnesium chelatase [Owenweeksia sp.]HBF21663.1 magnesium chelatase [Cryomorphaceae bacterium]|tara:strand:- start:4822 stop:5799 length:978 start_codon:yes stop_codon:yes gene_type:complete